jgi:fructose-1,6-bisphosphatase/inositol monophosphatase family enzyme
MSLAITELAAFAERLADASGPIARGYFRSGLNIDIKADDSPVTRADREVAAHLREMIAATYPDHG